MYCDAEEAVEATKMPTEARVLWGPVTKQVADAIGVPTAVASVLLRPSSATAERSGCANGSAGPSQYFANNRGHPQVACGTLGTI